MSRSSIPLQKGEQQRMQTDSAGTRPYSKPVPHQQLERKTAQGRSGHIESVGLFPGRPFARLPRSVFITGRFAFSARRSLALGAAAAGERPDSLDRNRIGDLHSCIRNCRTRYN
jgi:hypothetical protein